MKIDLRPFALSGLLLSVIAIPFRLWAQIPFSETFTNMALNPGWTLESPNPASTYQLTGSALNISASWDNGGSDLYSGTEFNAPRLLQPVDPNSDWVIETELAFTPANNYSGAGVLLASTNGAFTAQDNFSRIAERAYYPNGGGEVIRSAGAYVSYTAGTCFFRVQKRGTIYTGWYSADGANWVLNGTVTDTHSWPYIGLFVVRYPWDGGQVNSSAAFSYFKATLLAGNSSPTNFVPVSLSPVANAVNQRIVNTPTGHQVFEGVPFDLLPASTNNSWDAIGNTTAGDSSTQVMNLSVNIYGATEVYTLINTSWGYPGTLVPVTFTCTDGTSYTFNLTPGGEIRDWLDNVYVNALSDYAMASEVYGNVAASDGSTPARIDMQSISLPSAFATNVLTNICLIDNGVTGNTDNSYSHSIKAQRAFVYGVTVAAPPVVLNIAQQAGGAVALSWNTTLVGFTLESNTNLVSGVWTPVGLSPVVTGSQYVVTDVANAQKVFYQLQR